MCRCGGWTVLGKVWTSGCWGVTDQKLLSSVQFWFINTGVACVTPKLSFTNSGNIIASKTVCTVLLSCPVCPLLSFLSVCLCVTLMHCGQTVGRIKMKLGVEVGVDPGHIVLDGYSAPLPKRGTAPNLRPMSVVAKWLDGSRRHLVGR